MMYDGISFVIDSLTSDEIEDIISYDASDVVANISDEEFLEGLKRQHQYEHSAELTRGLLDELLGIKRDRFSTRPIKRKKTAQPRGGAAIQSSLKRSQSVGPVKRLPAQPPRSLGKLSQFRFRAQKSQKNLSKPTVLSQRNEPIITKRPKVHLSKLKTIKPLKDDLLDLIPPDPEELGVDMNQLLLATPENQDDQSDSVSFISSDDDSFIDYNNDDMMMDQVGQTMAKSDSRPGLESNIFDQYAPPSRDRINSLPSTQIFRCDNARCAFTTSNQMKLQLHSNAHSSAYHGGRF